MDARSRAAEEARINEREMWGEQGRPAALNKLGGPVIETPIDVGVNFMHTHATGWTHDSLISGILTKTQAEQFRCVLNNACSELNEHVGNPRVTEPLSSDDALTQILEAIDFQDWRKEHVEQIAAILRRAGRDVHSSDDIPF